MRIIDNMKDEKQLARARAEEALDIQQVAARYEEFISDALLSPARKALEA